ncbi:MAG: hypothetical protein JWN56_1284 [Sphingobacteriales bacterium]|nr:hypothetical protein [Sphingobacteriales bacterium]
MPSESLLEFKKQKFWVNDGYLIVFNLLLFEEIHLKYKNSIKELTKLKNHLADDALYMVVIEWITSITYDEFIVSDEVSRILIDLIDDIIFNVSTQSNYITRDKLNYLCNTARDYLHSINKNSEQFPENIDVGYGDGLPIKNYLYAFNVIKLFLQEKLDQNKIDGRIMG